MKKLLKLMMLTSVLFSTLTFANNPVKTSVVTIESELSNPVILVGSTDKNYLKISMSGLDLPNNIKRSPINLSLVIDRSTSMSGDKIVKAREAAILAVNMLEPTDSISIIGYDNSAQVILPATKVSDKKMITELIQANIQPQGMTALFEGVSKGINEVKKNLNKNHVNRVILLSDGQANVGPTSTSELGELGKMAASSGISITTIGLGDGYNEDLMTAIAGYSDGNHVFVNDSAQLEMAFSHEFSDVMSVVAQDVMIEIHIKGNVKPVRLLGRDGEITGQTVKVKMNQIYSNQEKYVLLEVLPEQGTNGQQKDLAEVKVTYLNMANQQTENHSDQLQVSYSNSKENVQKALSEQVVAEAAIQQSNIAAMEAAELMKQGDSEGANEKLRQNADDLNRMSDVLYAPEVKKQISERADMYEELSIQVEQAPASVSSKALAEDVYKTKTQQSKSSN